MSDSLQAHGLQHIRHPCPSLTPGVYSNPCPLIRWCHPIISSSVVLVSSCPQSLPASESFHNESVLCIRWPKYWRFSFSISLSNECSGLIALRTNWLDLAVQRTLRVFSKTQFKSISSSVLSFLYVPILTSIHDYWKTIDLARQTFVSKVMSLLFNTLSRLDTAFIPRSKRLLILWLQSRSAVILEPKKIKSLTLSIVYLFAMEWWERMPQY